MGVLKQWLPYVLSGISAGGQYALIAVGYTRSTAFCASSTSHMAIFSWSPV